MPSEPFTRIAGPGCITSIQTPLFELEGWLGARGRMYQHDERESLTKGQQPMYFAVPQLVFLMLRRDDGCITPEDLAFAEGLGDDDREVDAEDVCIMDSLKVVELLSLINQERGGAELSIPTRKWLNAVMGFHWHNDKWGLDKRLIGQIFCHILKYEVLTRMAAMAFVEVLRYMARTDRAHVGAEGNKLSLIYQLTILGADERESEYTEILQLIMCVLKRTAAKPEKLEKVNKMICGDSTRGLPVGKFGKSEC